MNTRTLKFIKSLVTKGAIPFTALTTLLCGFILLLSTPPIWEAVYDYAMPENQHPQLKKDAFTISKAFWNTSTYEDLNQDFRYRKLGKKEVSHFEDVRTIIRSLIYPLIVGALILLCWHRLLRRNIYWHWSLLQLVVLGGIFAIWGSIHWRHMFHTLHWWIFQNDSWILPKGCYSLILFPYAIWQTACLLLLFSMSFTLIGLSIPCAIEYLSEKSLAKKKNRPRVDKETVKD